MDLDFVLGSEGGRVARVVVVATSLVTLHVASDAESLAASGVGTLEGFLTGVRVAVDSERAWPRESLVACLADVSVLALRERCRGGRSDVVVVLPRVGAGGWAEADGDGHGRELLEYLLELFTPKRSPRQISFEIFLPEEEGADSRGRRSEAGEEE